MRTLCPLKPLEFFFALFHLILLLKMFPLLFHLLLWASLLLLLLVSLIPWTSLQNFLLLFVFCLFTSSTIHFINLLRLPLHLAFLPFALAYYLPLSCCRADNHRVATGLLFVAAVLQLKAKSTGEIKINQQTCHTRMHYQPSIKHRVLRVTKPYMQAATCCCKPFVVDLQLFYFFLQIF